MLSSLTQTFGMAIGSLLFFLAIVVGIMWLVLPIMVYKILGVLQKQVTETQELRYAIKYLANKIEERDKPR